MLRDLGRIDFLGNPPALLSHGRTDLGDTGRQVRLEDREVSCFDKVPAIRWGRYNHLGDIEVDTAWSNGISNMKYARCRDKVEVFRR
jgi:hypothetical protein